MYTLEKGGGLGQGKRHAKQKKSLNPQLKPSTLNPQLSTINSQLSTLDPKP
jgi:hypothetical protein